MNSILFYLNSLNKLSFQQIIIILQFIILTHQLKINILTQRHQSNRLPFHLRHQSLPIIPIILCIIPSLILIRNQIRYKKLPKLLSQNLTLLIKYICKFIMILLLSHPNLYLITHILSIHQKQSWSTFYPSHIIKRITTIPLNLRKLTQIQWNRIYLLNSRISVPHKKQNKLQFCNRPINMLKQHSPQFLQIRLQIHRYLILTHDLTHLRQETSIIHLMQINKEIIHPQCIIRWQLTWLRYSKQAIKPILPMIRMQKVNHTRWYRRMVIKWHYPYQWWCTVIYHHHR
jgi:hypothetical protein